MIRHTYRQLFGNNTSINVPLNSEKTCFNYREFGLDGDLVGVPPKRFLSGQSFIKLLKLVSRELNMVPLNNGKKEMCRFAEDMNKQTHCKSTQSFLVVSLKQ